jgi:hypothetical protein
VYVLCCSQSVSMVILNSHMIKQAAALRNCAIQRIKIQVIQSFKGNSTEGKQEISSRLKIGKALYPAKFNALFTHYSY